MQAAASRLLAKIEVQGVTNRTLQTLPVTRFLSEIRSQIHNTDEGKRVHVAALLSFLRSQSPNVTNLLAEQAFVDKAGFTLVELRAIQAESSNLLARIEARGMTNRVKQLGPLNGLLAGLRNRIAKIQPPRLIATNQMAARPVARPVSPWETELLPWSPPLDLLVWATNRPAPLTNLLFVPVPRLADESGASVEAQIDSAIAAADGYWIDSSTAVSWPGPAGSPGGVERFERRRVAWHVSEMGTTLETRRLKVRPQPSQYLFWSDPHEMALVGSFLMYRSGSEIRSLSLVGGDDVLEKDLPPSDGMALFELNGALGLMGGEAIFLRQPRSTETRLFAGLRRRPAQSPLDVGEGMPNRVDRAGPTAWAFPIKSESWVYDFAKKAWATNSPYRPVSTNWIHQFRWESRNEILSGKSLDGTSVESVQMDPAVLRREARHLNSRIQLSIRPVVGSTSLLMASPGDPGIWLIPSAMLRPHFPVQLDTAAFRGVADRLQSLTRAEKEALIKDPSLHVALWRVLDSDHDGALTPGEMRWFDLDNNGKIFDPEADNFARVASAFAAYLTGRFDRNRDGVIDGDERAVMGDEYPYVLRFFDGVRGVSEPQMMNTRPGLRAGETKSEMLARDVQIGLIVLAMSRLPKNTTGWIRFDPDPDTRRINGWVVDGIARVSFVNAINVIYRDARTSSSDPNPSRPAAKSP